jgi:hypothetical protein
MHEIENPTTNNHGDEVHPAFAMIRANRISVSGGRDGGAVLFDSDVVHNNTVRITLETATRKRDGNHDYIHGGKQLMEVEMSEAQWASFVSSMNTSGVPATLRWLPDGDVPGLPYAPRLALSMAEVREATAKAMAKIREARDAYEVAVESKAGAKAIKEARSKLHYVIENADKNMAWAAESLNRHTENVVTKARADIEAAVYQHAAQLGMSQGQVQGMVALPVLEGEVMAELEQAPVVPGISTRMTTTTSSEVPDHVVDSNYDGEHA